MKLKILALSLGVGAMLLIAQQLNAQDRRNCADRAQVVARLAELYGEARQSIGLAANNQVVEVFASPETGSWTITVTLPSGLTCLVAAGGSFERLDEDLTPAALGEPV